jgi:Rps23 Pro-64 3,4-dihydroxylase Tpa1-like proline 4-hydroxylase
LRPKKAKQLLPEVAEKVDLPEQAVKDIIDFYWQEVRKSLSSLKHSRVHITNLGDFTIKHWKLDDRITMIEKFKENFKQKGLQEIVTRFRTDETLFDLKAIKKMMEEEQQRKDFIKLHKTQSHEPTREHNKDLEK